MQLRDQLESDGDWLFTRRSFLPLLLVPILMAALNGPVHAPGTMVLSDLAGYTLAVLGLLTRCCVVGFIPPGSSGRNMRHQKASALNTRGLYSLVRHPLYVGNFLVVIGWCMSSANGGLILVVTLVYILYYERIALREEAFLHGRFGGDFLRWAECTPACLPNSLRWARPDRGFDWAMVVRREYQTVCLVVAGFVLVHLLRAALVPMEAASAARWVSIGMFDLVAFCAAWLTFRRLRLHRSQHQSAID
ncbi:MAG: hypothetical protein JNG89_05215 [Planctomycetaceae bacterium]|nr:hypothetical protein [Planctomycetaceae bacterium]